MRTFSKVVDLLAIGILVSLPLTTACSLGTTSQAQRGVPAPQGVVDKAPQPLVPRQFTEVAEVDWTPDKPLVGREIECQNGKVRIFDCKDISLLAFLPESLVGGPTFTALKG